MVILEEKKDNSYTYTVPEIFGTIVLFSSKKLVADDLDKLISAVMNNGSPKGSVSLEKDRISWTYEKAPQWEEEEKEEEGKVVKNETKIKNVSRVRQFKNWLISKLQ